MSKDSVELGRRLQALTDAIIEEARTNPGLARRLERALSEGTDEEMASKRKARGGRRDPPSLDPFILYEQGEDDLRHALAELTIEQLKDIVAGYRMPRHVLALRWKTTNRLVELIVDTVKSRTHKGDVFLG